LPHHYDGGEGVVPRDEWFCAVLRVVIDSSAGFVELSIDGDQAASSEAVRTLLSEGYDCLTVGIDWTGVGQAPLTVLVDEVVLATTPLGCDR
jgi:hypothetical protein